MLSCFLYSTYPPCGTISSDRRKQIFIQNNFVESTIHAIVAYAEAIRKVCGSSGLCGALTSMSPETFHKQYLSKVDFTYPNNFIISALRGRRIAFDVNGDPLTADVTFFIYNFTIQQVRHSFRILLFKR